jgi:PTS system mannose-specific IID component
VSDEPEIPDAGGVPAMGDAPAEADASAAAETSGVVDAPEAPRVKPEDLARTTTRALHIQALLTPERMQGPGFAFALLPVLERLYPERGELGRAIRRHLAYFATHPLLAGYVLGATARWEERRAAGDPVSDEAIDTWKRALASPLAAMGDPFFWVTLRPLAGLVGVLAIALIPAPVLGPDWRVLLCPLLTLLTYNAFALPFRVVGTHVGYIEAERPAALLRSLHLREWDHALGCAGALGYGALLALVIRFLDFGSIGWGLDAAAKVAAAVPLLLGAVIGWIGLKRWPGRVVEVALAALAAALVLGGLV